MISCMRSTSAATVPASFVLRNLLAPGQLRLQNCSGVVSYHRDFRNSFLSPIGPDLLSKLLGISFYVQPRHDWITELYLLPRSPSTRAGLPCLHSRGIDFYLRHISDTFVVFGGFGLIIFRVLQHRGSAFCTGGWPNAVPFCPACPCWFGNLQTSVRIPGITFEGMVGLVAEEAERNCRDDLVPGSTAFTVGARI
ncbi:hypothetical protein R1flu_022985 [Riccia fluitans]|uniref:Uncharacterized protein n=1 Tax=Riccia fluitans TaxID=41844 RepID=A0ABD1XUT9_9MARC